MKRLIVGLVVAGLMGCGGLLEPHVPVRPQGGPRVQRITKGVSPQAAVKLRAAAERNAREHDKALLARWDAAATRIASALAPETAALEAQLKQHPQYAAYGKELDALFKQLPAGKRSPEQLRTETARLRTALQSLDKKYAGMFATAHSQARIDQQKVTQVLSRELREFLGPKMVIEARPGLVWVGSAKGSQAPPPPTPAAFRLQPPYDVGSSDSSSILGKRAEGGWTGWGDVGNWLEEHEADQSSGSFRTYSNLSLYQGTLSSRAEVGSYVTVPAGFTRLNVTAKVNGRKDCFAHAGTWHCESAAYVVLELTDLTGQTIRQDIMIGWACAPGGGIATDAGTLPPDVGFTFPISSAGGQYLVRAGSFTTVMGGTKSWQDAEEEGTVESISVEAVP